MQLTVLFWNIWLDNQIQGQKRLNRLLDELNKIIQEYQPDYIGLNEVIKDNSAKHPTVLEFLKEHGYKYTKFAPAFPIENKWIGGAGVASKYKLHNVQDVVISKDTAAEKRGYQGSTIKAICASLLSQNGKKIRLIVAHPLFLSLRYRTLPAHLEGTRKIRDLILPNINFQDNIVGGDFNESVLWPRSFRRSIDSYLNHKTGSILRPTWSHKAHKITPVRVNLDHLYWSKYGELKLKDFKVIKTNVSDHRPIVGVFEVL